MRETEVQERCGCVEQFLSQYKQVRSLIVEARYELISLLQILLVTAMRSLSIYLLSISLSAVICTLWCQLFLRSHTSPTTCHRPPKQPPVFVLDINNVFVDGDLFCPPPPTCRICSVSLCVVSSSFLLPLFPHVVSWQQCAQLNNELLTTRIPLSVLGDNTATTADEKNESLCLVFKFRRRVQLLAALGCFYLLAIC